MMKKNESKQAARRHTLSAGLGIVGPLALLCTVFALGLSSQFATASITPEESSCVQCHQSEVDEENTELVENYLHGAHAKRGVTCAGCHGGDPSLEDGDEAMSEDNGFIGAPERHEIPEFCARCHADPNYMRGFNPNLPTDQYAKYKVSGHGRKLAATEDNKVAVCTSCHGVHGIQGADSPASPVFPENVPHTCAGCHSDADYMKGHNLPTDQFTEYQHSVHGEALLEKHDRAAPSCASCHGSHEARIPDPSGVANTCAQCHNFIRDLFVGSPHKKVHEENNYPECEVCHGNHDIERASDVMLSAGEKSGGVCSECHDAGSKGMQTAITMRSAIDELRNVIDTTESLLSKADTIGLDIEQTEFQLSQAQSELHKSRALIHTFDAKQVTEVTAGGMKIADEAKESAAKLLERYSFRRRMFFISVVVILALAGLLALKIRQIDKEIGIQTD